jgi:hypothetical protein
MRQPRMQFTVRRLMVAIAIAAIVSEIVIVDRRFKRLSMASYHENRQALYESAGVRYPWDENRNVQVGRSTRYWAIYHAKMRRKWEEAVERPWLPVATDPL